MQSSSAKSAAEIVIDKKFRDLIPPLRDDERAQLEESLKESGCRDPLIAWEGQSILLDGHHRHEICQANGIEFEVRFLPFPDRRAAMDWMVLNQLGRRNLAPKEAALLRGKLYHSLKKDVPNKRGANQHKKEVKGQSDPQPTTAQRVAKKAGVSEKTVKRDAAYAAAAEELGDQFDKSDSKSETIRKAKLKRGELPAEAEPAVKKSEAPDGGSDATTPTTAAAPKTEGAGAVPEAGAGQQSPATHPEKPACAEPVGHVGPEPEGGERFTLSDGSEHQVRDWLDGAIPRRKLVKGLKRFVAMRTSAEAATYERLLIEMANAANQATRDLPERAATACAKAAGRMIWELTD